MWQNIIVALILAAALIYVVLRFKGKAGPKNSACNDCAQSRTCKSGGNTGCGCS